MGKGLVFLGFLIGILGSVGVGGFPAEDLVVRLPGQPEVGFRQFAGHVDVDLRHGRSLFYYFVEADKDPDKKPLTLWLNGGLCPRKEHNFRRVQSLFNWMCHFFSSFTFPFCPFLAAVLFMILCTLFCGVEWLTISCNIGPQVGVLSGISIINHSVSEHYCVASLGKLLNSVTSIYSLLQAFPQNSFTLMFTVCGSTFYYTLVRCVMLQILVESQQDQNSAQARDVHP